MHRGLLVEPDNCRVCYLRGVCKRVPPEGDPHAKIALVGMGPGCLPPWQYVSSSLIEEPPRKIVDWPTTAAVGGGVTALHEGQYIGELITFRAFGHETTVTAEHRVLVRESARSGHRRKTLSALTWKPAGDLTPGDFVLIPKLHAVFGDNQTVEISSIRREHNRGNKIVFNRTWFIDECAFFLGAFIGDGSANWLNGNVTWHLSRGYKEQIIPPLRDWLTKIGFDVHVRTDSENIGVSVYSRVLADFFENAFYVDGEKRIPPFVRGWSAANINRFLFGWYQTDGRHTRGPNRPGRICTTSESAFVDGVDLFLKLGLLPTIQRPRHRETEKQCYEFGLSSTMIERAGWPLSTTNLHRDKFQEDVDFWYVPIREVSRQPYIGVVHDLTTCSRTYNTPFVVHNSNEEIEQKLFVGRSGQLLNQILTAAGLRREDIWLTNAALAMPRPMRVRGGGIIPKTKVEKQSIAACRSRLLRELAVVQPEVVVAIGAQPMEALCDDVHGMTRLVGSLIPITRDAGFEAIVIPSFHPAHLLRGEQRFFPVVVSALKKAKRLATAPPAQLGNLFIIDPVSATIDRDLDQLDALVDDVLRSGEDIAVDVETTDATPLDCDLTVVGFGSLTRKLGVAITVRTWVPELGRFMVAWTTTQWRRVNAIIAKLLAGANTKIYHNYGFDVSVLERFYVIGGAVRDTMILHHLAWPDVLHGLDFVVQYYLDVPPWKYYFRKGEERRTGTHRDLLIYNAQDSLYTALVFPHVLHDATERGNLHIEEHQLAMADMARRAHLRGLPVDLQRWDSIYAEHLAKRDAALAILRNAISTTPEALESFTNSMKKRRYARATAGGKVCDEAEMLPLSESGLSKERKAELRQGKLLTVEDWNPNSGDHGSWYLYELLRLVPTKFTKGGAEKDETKKVASASYKGVLVYMADPRVKAYVDRAEEEAIIRRLNEIRNKIHPRTKRLHPHWNCYDAATEVLTDQGFLPIAYVVRNLERLLVAQFDPNSDEISFVRGTDPIETTSTEMVSIETVQVSLRVTPNHRLLLRERPGRKKSTKVFEAADFDVNRRLIHAGYYRFGDEVLPQIIIRLLAAVQADGSWHNGAWRFNFEKERKYTRLCELLKQLGEPFTTKVGRSGETDTLYHIRWNSSNTTHVLHALIGTKRLLGKWLLRLSAANVDTFLDEVRFWDSHVDETGFIYASTYAANVSWIQTLAVLRGHRAVAARSDYHPTGCIVNVRPQRRYSAIGRNGTHEHGLAEPVYCLSVPSSFLVVRRSGRVVVAGNSSSMKGTRWVSKVNVQNLDKWLKKIFHQIPGRKWVGADAAQIEYRVAAFLAGITELLTLFNAPPYDENNPDEKWKKFSKDYDAHSLIAEEVFQDLFRKGTPEIQGALRTMVKRVVYALFYGAFPEKIYTTILEDHRVPSSFRQIVSLEYIERIHTGFSARFPEWSRWADQQTMQVRFHSKQVFPPFNRVRFWSMAWMIEETKIRNCVDAKTEALTQRGWIPGFELQRDDILLTKNLCTGELEWQAMIDLKLWPDYTGEIYEFRSKTFSAVTTPDHRWPVFNGATGRNEEQTSATLSRYGNHRIHRTGVYLGPRELTFSDDFVQLAGWFLTDGSFSMTGTNKTRSTVHLHQSLSANPHKSAMIRALVERMGILTNQYAYKRTAWSGQSHVEARWRLTASTSATLHTLFPDRVLTLRFIQKLTGAQAKLLVSTMMLGDGHEDAFRKRTFCTGRREAADAFQALCVLAGIATTIHKRDMSKYKPKSKLLNNVPKMGTVFYVTLLRRDKVQVQKAHVRTSQAAVGVWCPIVPNTFFVARREGQVYITGNTPIQLAAGDIVNIMFRQMDEDIRAAGIDAIFVIHAHDACYWDTADKDVPKVIEIVNRCFDTWLRRVDERTGREVKVHIYGQAKASRALEEV